MASLVFPGTIDLFSRSSWWFLCLGVAGLLLARGIWRQVLHVRNEKKIKQYGGRAPEFGGWLPFGMYRQPSPQDCELDITCTSH